MAAVDQLLARLTRLDEAVDLIASPIAGVQTTALATLARGVAVEGLVCFEQFLAERSAEWASSLTSARVNPSKLPGGSKRFEDRMVQALPRLLQSVDAAQRATVIDEVGRTLMSLSTATLEAHRLAFGWIGSNVQTTDIEFLLALAGVKPDRPWSEVTVLWQRVDQRYPGNTSAKSLFESFAGLRHDAAHAYAANLPLANLLSVARNVRLVAMCIDVLVSEGLRQLKIGQSPVDIRAAQIPVRKVIRDGSRWPEYAPGNTRAYRRHPTMVVGLDLASTRASANAELVLALDGNRLLDWRYPAL